MKRLSAVLAIIFLLTGCNPFDSSDYDGVVLSVSDESILVCPCDGDPEAEYPVYEIFAEADTAIAGDKTEFAEIEEEDMVRVWVKDEEAAILVAERISVESEGN